MFVGRKYPSRVLTQFLILIAFGIRLLLLQLRQHPSSEEVWALLLAEASVKEIWFATFADFHGPFYFILLHLWKLLSPFSLSIVQLRIFSLVFGMFGCLGMWYLATLVAGKRVGYISLILSLFLPAFVWPAVFARYYSLLIFLTIVSTALFIHYLKTNKIVHLISLIFVFTIGIYTHYYFSLLSLSFTAYLLVNVKYRKQIIKWLSAQGIVFLLFAPGLFYLITLPKPDLIGRHANSLLKIPSLVITNIISSETLIFLYYFRNPWMYLLPLLALFIVTVILLVNVFRNWHSEFSKLLILMLIVPPAALMLFAYIVKPLLSLGSLMIFIPALIILLAKSIEIDFNKTKLLTFAFILLVGVSLYFLFDTSTIYTHPRKDFLYFSKSFTKGDIALHSHLGSFLLGTYYSERENNFEIIHSGSVTPQTAIGVGYNYISPEELKKHEGGVWYFESPYLEKRETERVKSLIESEFTKIHEEKFTATFGETSETYFNVYYYK